MSAQPQSRMTVDEFLVWADGRPGRFELVDGGVVAMSPQTGGHIRTKSRVHAALVQAISASGLDCEAMADGMTVRIDAQTAFEPDALIQCGEPIADSATEASSPILVVEVLSPSTKHVDTVKKLEGYFRVPSIIHHLIIDIELPIVIHHRRGGDGGIETRILGSGRLDLDPPGLTLDSADLFAKT